MRVAVVLVWRPKHFPHWNGRAAPGGSQVPKGLDVDKGVAPYSAVHVASLLPRHWDVTVVHESVRDFDLDAGWDAVFLSTMDYCADHARWLGHQLRARGAKVVAGGLHPTLTPDFYADCADAVVVGEAEGVMPRLAADLERGRLEPRYQAPVPQSLADLPVPRYDLVETDFHLPLAYEATRGCPFTCSFCVLSAIREPYRRRPIPNVLRDIDAVPSGWNWVQRRWVTFWDNNLGADRQYFRDLCEALVPKRRVWGTETSFDTITRESARLMGRAGCRFVYIGLESLAEESLRLSNKRQNKVREYRERIAWLRANGMVVMSIFILGLDGDTPEYLKRLPDLIHQVGVDIPVLTLPVPIERTPFRAELQSAGRLLDGDLYGGMDGVHLVFEPRAVSPDELEYLYFDAIRRVHSRRRVAARMLRSLRSLPAGAFASLVGAGSNFFYREHQMAIAETGFARLSARGRWPGGAQPAESAPSLPVFGFPALR
jgi:radical SAM superfamily enzyme YgiQ (UPF0313 family)